MNVFLKPFSGKIFKNNAIFKIDNGDNIFYNFKKILKKSAININTIDLGGIKEKDTLVFCDIPYFWETDYWKYLLFSKNKKILFNFESPLVNPFSHFKIFHGFFETVYTWNDRIVDTKKIKKLHIPVLKMNEFKTKYNFKNKKMLSMINSNKSIPFLLWLISPFKNNLYPKRLEAINFFENRILEQFDLYGRGWNKPRQFNLFDKIFEYKKFKSYKGNIPRDSVSKIKILSKYKFNLCFENCIADGYISEKIFDCFKARTVPIYLGSPNIQEYLPENSFIDFRKFRNYDELLRYVSNMKENEYQQYVKDGQKIFKNKEILSKWSEDAFIKFFVKNVQYDNSFMMGGRSQELKYIAHNKKRYDYVLQIIDDLQKNNHKIINILDIGTSPFTFLLKQKYKNANISTIDYSSKFGDLCKLNNIEFKQIDLNKPINNIYKCKYDIVTFLEVIEHLNSNHAVVLEKISRMIRPKGYLILQTPNKFSPKSIVKDTFWNLFSNIKENPKEFEHFKEYSLNELINLVKSIGNLKIIKATHTTYYDHPSSTIVYRKYKPVFIPIMFVYYLLTLIIYPLRRGMTMVLQKQN